MKFGYFYVSRELIVENLRERDVSARKYLQESRDFSRWAAGDRANRTPSLTKEQRKQMQDYLELMAANNKEVYPTRSARG